MPMQILQFIPEASIRARVVALAEARCLPIHAGEAWVIFGPGVFDPDEVETVLRAAGLPK